MFGKKYHGFDPRAAYRLKGTILVRLIWPGKQIGHQKHKSHPATFALSFITI